MGPAGRESNQPPPEIIEGGSEPNNNPVDFRAPKISPYREPEFPSDFTEMQKENDQQRAERKVREVVERWGERIQAVIDNWILEDWLKERKPSRLVDLLEKPTREQLIDLLQTAADYHSLRFVESLAGHSSYLEKIKAWPAFDSKEEIADCLEQTEREVIDARPKKTSYEYQMLKSTRYQYQILKSTRAVARLERARYAQVRFVDFNKKEKDFGFLWKIVTGKSFIDQYWLNFKNLSSDLDRQRQKFYSIDALNQALEENKTMLPNDKEGLAKIASQLIERRAALRKELGDLEWLGGHETNLAGQRQAYQLFLDAELNVLAERYGLTDLDQARGLLFKLKSLTADPLRSAHLNTALELRQKITDLEKITIRRREIEKEQKEIEAKLNAVWLIIRNEQNNLSWS